MYPVIFFKPQVEVLLKRSFYFFHYTYPALVVLYRELPFFRPAQSLNIPSLIVMKLYISSAISISQQLSIPWKPGEEFASQTLK